MNMSSDLGIYSRLLAYVIPYWGAFLLSMIGFLLYSLANVGFVQLIAFIVDSLGENTPELGSGVKVYFEKIFGPANQLDRVLIPLGIVLIAILRGVGSFSGNYFIALVANNLVHNLRCELFGRLLSLPSSFYDKHAMGHLVSKVTYHVSQVTDAATDAVRIILREGFTVLGYLALLLYLNWKLTFLFVLVAPLIGLLVTYASKRFRRISERIQVSVGGITHVASEAIQGHREVRTFGGKEFETARFENVSGDNRRQSIKMVMTASLATPVIQFLVSLSLAGLVWLVLDPIFLADMSAGSVIAFITTGGLLAKPIRNLSEVVAKIQRGLAAAEDIFDVFDETPEQDDGKLMLDEIEGSIEFKDVSFGYQQEASRVLQNISLRAKPGETVALVGKSGSGKSTLVSLIPRFYEVTSGQILLDNEPLQNFALSGLREHISIVSQQVVLFNDSILNNIRYGSLKKSSREQVEEAAKKSFAWEFIVQMPDGLDTIVGDNGVMLSGGQRQRIAIARAFLKDAPVLILDEATSALDTESEKSIRSALGAVVKGRTTFVIAHRLSTIEMADRIFVLDQGRVAEAGTHQDLLDAGGAYARLHQADDWTPKKSKNVSRMPEENSDRTVSWNSPNLPIETSRIVNAWYSDAGWLYLLRPLEALYRASFFLRKLYLRLSSKWSSQVPVIVVGNLTVGGTGKTPFVVSLVKHLKIIGYRPGVISRGYGGNADSYPLDMSDATGSYMSGDEPYLIRRRTSVPVVVDPDRVQAAKTLLANHQVDLIISDDGLQHYKLDRDFEVLIVDGERGFGNGFCLPAGPLREPISRLKTIDLVLVNGNISSKLISLDKKPFKLDVVPTRLVNLGSGEEREVDALKGVQLIAMAALGNANRFWATLNQLGYNYRPIEYPDHYSFNEQDLSFVDEVVLLTEKDAVKVKYLNINKERIWYLEVEAIVQEEVMERITRILG